MSVEPFPSWPHHDQEQLDSVASVLSSGRVNYWNGEQGIEFEREFAAYLGVDHAVACANGTLALELGLRALGISPDDEVVVPARTFIATASAVVAVGARPVFADVDLDSGGLTAETVAEQLTDRTTAVIAVHLGGWPCDIEAIRSLCDSRGLYLIEDCAQAHGARSHGRPVGTFGHVAAFSFCTDKIISTGGEGGMLVTDDEAVWRRAWQHKDHGKDYGLTRVDIPGEPTGFRWVHATLGSNYRMTEMQSAIGRIQLRSLDEWVARRAANAALLAEGLSGTPGLRLVAPSPDTTHAWYRYYAYVEEACLLDGWSRDRILSHLMARGLPCQSGSCSEVYREKAIVDAGYAPPTPLPNAARSQRESIAVLVHPTLGAKHMAAISSGIRELMFAATGQDERGR